MRRLARLLLVLAALAPARAGAEDEPVRAEASLRVYQDDDHVRVLSPGARVAAPLPFELSLVVSTAVDALSAASVDVTSQASPYGFEEERVEGGVELRWAATPTRTLSTKIEASTEHDFDSLQLGLGARVELARRNATLDLAYTAAFATVGRAGDPGFARDRHGQRLALTFTQILDAATYLDAVVDGALDWGYLASPYRYVWVHDAAGAPLYSLPEATPEARGSLAGLLRVRRALGGGLFAHLDYRLYLDTWAVTSHTATATLAWATADDRLVLGLHGRGYLQSAASFYDHAPVDAGGAPAWRTRDRALGGVRSAGLSLAVEWAFLGGAVGAAPQLSLSLGAMRFVWLDFPDQAGRSALVTSAGLSWPF